jgi:hypothetical protein
VAYIRHTPPQVLPVKSTGLKYLFCYHFSAWSVTCLQFKNLILKIGNMVGGGGKPNNIFKLNRGDDPKEVLNWRLWFAVFSFGIMGAARGKICNAYFVSIIKADYSVK